MAPVDKPNPARVIASIAALAVAPFVLTMWVGAPVPHDWPTAEQWSDFFDGLDPHHLDAAFRIFLWVCWLVLAAGTIWEIATYLTTRSTNPRGHTKRGPLRILGGLVLGTTTATAITNPAVAATTVAEQTDTIGHDQTTHPNNQVKPRTAAARATPAPITSTTPPADERYVVRPDDNLSVIADDKLGTERKWTTIYQRNKNKPQPDGDRLTDPDLIQPGWILTIPTSNSPSDGDDPDKPEPESGEDDNPTPTPDSHDDFPRHHPEPRLTDEDTTAHSDADSFNRVALALGTIVSIGFIVGLAAALRAARRRLTRYRRETGDDADVDLTLPKTLASLESAIRHRPSATETPSALGEDSDGQPTLLAAAASGGLGLTGPGAPSVARAAITAALADSDQDAQSSGIDIVITQDVLNQLALSASITPGIHRLHVAADAHHAERALFREIMAKNRHTDEPAPDAADDVGQIIAVLDADTLDTNAITTLLSQGRSLNVGALILGDWNANTIYIDGDGATDTDNPDRCYIMDPDTFTDTLSTLTNIATTTEEPITPPEDTTAESTTSIPTVDAADSRTVRPVRHVALPSTLTVKVGTALRHAVVHPTPRYSPKSHSHEAPPEPTSVAVETSSDNAPATQHTRAVHLTVFGNVQAHANGQPIHFTRVKGRELLALLATEPHGLSADTISEFIVGETRVTKARSHLASIITSTRGDLRKATGTDKTTWFINYHNGRYTLDDALISSDLTNYISHLAAAQETTDTTEYAENVGKAIELYKDDYATDFTDDTWPEAIRTTYRTQAYQACLDLANHHLTTNQTDKATSILNRATGIDPYNETAYARLIQIYISNGESSQDTTAVYKRLKSQLAKINKHPSQETQNLLRVNSCAPREISSSDDVDGEST